MNKAAIILLTIFAIAFLTSCGAMRNRRTTDVGVVINGTRWATRNVDAPGTFARHSEDAGMLYQWNRRMAWSATDEEVTGWLNRLRIRNRDRSREIEWDTSIPDGETWERVNDPCPPGWRVPTEAELQLLKEAGSTWITQNGVNGRLFGTAPNQIFLPAAGWRDSNGVLDFTGVMGCYWSNAHGISACEYELAYFGLHETTIADMLKQGNILFARDFVFTNIDALVSILNSNRERGLSIRCVSEN